MDEAIRLLKLAARELGATDVRLELAANPGEHPDEIAWTVRRPWRLVARFDGEPSDVADKRATLAELAASFHEVLHDALEAAPEPGSGSDKTAALAELLEILRERLHARWLVIVDEQSPILWGSAPALPELRDVNAALDEPPADTPHALPALMREALPRARERRASLWDRSNEGGYCSKSFAGIYRLVIGFDPGFSELAAEATIRRALPVIERMVSSLPPRDPAPRRPRLSLRRDV